MTATTTKQPQIVPQGALTATGIAELTDVSTTKVRRLTKKLRPVCTVANRTYFSMAEFVALLVSDAVERKVVAASDDPRERVDAARADQLELKNAVTRGQLVSLDGVVTVEAKKAALLARNLDSVPGRLKRRFPDTAGAVLSALDEELARARNRVVDEFVEWVENGAVAEETDSTA